MWIIELHSVAVETIIWSSPLPKRQCSSNKSYYNGWTKLSHFLVFLERREISRWQPQCELLTGRKQIIFCSFINTVSWTQQALKYVLNCYGHYLISWSLCDSNHIVDISESWKQPKSALTEENINYYIPFQLLNYPRITKYQICWLYSQVAI